MIAPIILAVAAAAAQPNSFGASNEYEWACFIEVDEGSSKFRGWWTVTSEGSFPNQIHWTSKVPIEVLGQGGKSTIRQSGIFKMTDGDQMFSKGKLIWDWDVHRKLPGVMLVNFGTDPATGSFVSILTRDGSEKGMANGVLDVGQFMRWVGPHDAIHFSIDQVSKELYSQKQLGSGLVDVAIYHKLEKDLAAVRTRLAAKAADFQNQCTRVQAADLVI